MWSQGYSGLHVIYLRGGNLKVLVLSQTCEYLCVSLVSLGHMDLAWRYWSLSFTVKSIQQDFSLSECCSCTLKFVYWTGAFLSVTFPLIGLVCSLFSNLEGESLGNFGSALFFCSTCLFVADAMFRIKRTFGKQPRPLNVCTMSVHFSVFLIFSTCNFWRVY